MDTFTLIAKLADALAWPVASLALILLLRDEIGRLLPFLKKLKAGPVEAEFEREVKELRATAEVQPQLLPLPEGITSEKQLLLQLVQVSPRSAILEAWRGVEEASIRLVQSKGVFVAERESKSPLSVVRALTREKLLGAEEIGLYHDLRVLRNQAAHAQDFAPTTDAALSYIELAGRLRQALERAAQ